MNDCENILKNGKIFGVLINMVKEIQVADKFGLNHKKLDLPKKLFVEELLFTLASDSEDALRLSKLVALWQLVSLSEKNTIDWIEQWFFW